MAEPEKKPEEKKDDKKPEAKKPPEKKTLVQRVVGICLAILTVGIGLYVAGAFIGSLIAGGIEMVMGGFGGALNALARGVIYINVQLLLAKTAVMGLGQSVIGIVIVALIFAIIVVFSVAAFKIGRAMITRWQAQHAPPAP